MQSIKIKSRPSLKNKEVEPVEPVDMNIYQSNTYQKDLSWLHLDNEHPLDETHLNAVRGLI